MAFSVSGALELFPSDFNSWQNLLENVSYVNLSLPVCTWSVFITALKSNSALDLAIWLEWVYYVYG